MKKNTLKTIVISNEDLVKILNEVETSINKDVLPSLESLITKTKDIKKISDNVLYGRLKLKDDSEFFKRLEKVVSKYNDIISNLKDKVENELSDTVTGTSGNINNNIAIAMISEGIFLSNTLVGLLQFIIANNYSEQKVDMDKKIVSENIKNTLILVKLIPELEKADIKKVVVSIGEVPVLKTLRHEETSDIPVELALGFFKDTFKFKSDTLSLIKSFITSTNNTTTNTPEMMFIGNPIYHIRMLLVDIDELRLESYNNEVRLLELRILELKSKDTDKPEIIKAIKYYENKVTSLRLKIAKISKLD